MTEEKTASKHPDIRGCERENQFPPVSLFSKIPDAPCDSTGGVEAPGARSVAAELRELTLKSQDSCNLDQLPFVLGWSEDGTLVIENLAEMRHVLVGGCVSAEITGCLNSLLTGLLLSRTPDEMRLILIGADSGVLQAYKHTGHLAMPFITNAKEAGSGLRWAITEMERRWHLFKNEKVRDINGYNALVGNDAGPVRLPYIVIVVDELAELMGVAKQEIESYIVRLASLSRGSGIHMVLATQRPTVGVVTGTIKSHIPGRIAFRVAHGNDSRTILDTLGAENLPGKGDMLYLPFGKNKPIRLQGAWINPELIRRVTDWLRTQRAPEFLHEIGPEVETIPDMEPSGDTTEISSNNNGSGLVMPFLFPGIFRNIVNRATPPPT